MPPPGCFGDPASSGKAHAQFLPLDSPALHCCLLGQSAGLCQRIRQASHAQSCLPRLLHGVAWASLCKLLFLAQNYLSTEVTTPLQCPPAVPAVANALQSHGQRSCIAGQVLHLALKPSCCLHTGVQLCDQLRDDGWPRDPATCTAWQGGAVTGSRCWCGCLACCQATREAL